MAESEFKPVYPLHHESTLFPDEEGKWIVLRKALGATLAAFHWASGFKRTHTSDENKC